MKIQYKKINALGAVIALIAGFQLHAETYTYIGSSSRGQNNVLENWVATDGVSHPDYAPTSEESGTSGHVYVVRDNKRLPVTANAASLSYYGNVVIGEVGGTKGTIESECQKGNTMYFNNVTFANGDYWDGGANGIHNGTDCRGNLNGNITVTAPESAPFTFTFRYGTAAAPRKVICNAVFNVAEGCAYKYNDTHDAIIVWRGSLANFHGTLDLSRYAGMTVIFENTIGTTSFKEIKICGGATHTNNCVTAPLTAKTLTIGDGATFRLAASTSGDSVSHASLKCDTAAIDGTLNLVLDEFADPVSHTNLNFEIVLFEATDGGLSDEMFNVDFGSNADKDAFQGCAVNGDGTKLIARFSFQADAKYYLTAAATGAYGNIADSTAWMRIDGETERAPTNPQNEIDQCEFVVNQGRRAYDSSYTVASRDIYGKSITFGEVGGTSGDYGFTSCFLSAYTYFHATAYFAKGMLLIRGNWHDASHRTGARMRGDVVITAPATAPFEFWSESGSVDRPWLVRFENTFAGDANCGIKATGSGAHVWEFLGDVSGYEGAMDFSANANLSIKFGADAGDIDMKELKFAADQKIELVGRADGADYMIPCLQAETFTLGGDIDITLDLSEKLPRMVYRLAVLRTTGSIDASKVKVQASGAGSNRFKGVLVETSGGVTTFYAQVPPPGFCLIIE